MNAMNYDLVIIGSGPAGQKAAIAAAKARKRVAVIDKTTMIGGVCVHTGTIPSKAVREAILQLTGFAVKALYGDTYGGSGDISVEDLSLRVNTIIGRETQVIRAQLKRNGVSIHQGAAQFLDAHIIEVQSDNGDTTKLEAEKILIACGTRPARSAEIPFDDHRVVDTDHLGLGQIPREIIIVGAGVVGLEYASFMAALDVDVILIDQRPIFVTVHVPYRGEGSVALGRRDGTGWQSRWQDTAAPR